DLPHALTAKMEELRESSVLELQGLDRESAPLGRLSRLREWMHRSQAGYSERARQLGLRSPRGVLLVGVQGCGKSLAAKAIAREWGGPLAPLMSSPPFHEYMG